MSNPSAATRSLVLGGGGPVGRAWQSGLAAGFGERGVSLGSADLIVGTSAGAIVGAELALGRDPHNFVPAPTIVASPAPSTGLPPEVQAVFAALGRVPGSSASEEELQKIGQLALKADVPDEQAAVGRSNLAFVTGRPWLSNFRATAVSIRTGRLQVFGPSSGAPLEAALAASSALPGVWPPITIGDDRYMDGGVRSNLNADVARGCDRVIVVSCRDLQLDAHFGSRTPTNQALLNEVAALRSQGSIVDLVVPTPDFIELTHDGALLLNTALEAAAFALGRRQGVAESRLLKTIWRFDPTLERLRLGSMTASSSAGRQPPGGPEPKSTTRSHDPGNGRSDVELATRPRGESRGPGRGHPDAPSSIGCR